MQTTRRLTTGAVLIAVLALFAGACSSSDSEGASTTTEKKQTTTTEADGTDTDETTDTVTDEEFDAAVAEVSDQITAANGDTCGLFEVLQGDVQLPDPSTPAQVKTGLELIAQLFGDIADAAPADQAAAADAIRTGIADYQTAAAENDYDPEWFNSTEADPFTSEEFSAALDTFYTSATALCAPETSTTVAG